MWDLSSPGIKPALPTLEGRVLTTGLPEVPGAPFCTLFALEDLLYNSPSFSFPKAQ